MQKVKLLFKNHSSWLDIIVCFLLAFIITDANMFISTDKTEHTPLTIAQSIGTFACFYILSIIFRILFQELANSKLSKNKFSKLLNKIFNSKHSFLIITFIIFCCWIPALIMLYPGTLINDSWGQLNQVLELQNGNWTLSAHHPVFDTAIMSIIIIPIRNLFNNWHIGFFAYTIIQAFCTSLTFAFSITYMHSKFKQSKLVSFIFLLIYCFFPIFVASVQTISKDALSAWIYLLFIICFIEIIRTKNAFLKSKRSLFTFLAVCTLCILTKKVETYIILGSLVSLLIFQKENRIRTLIPIGFVLVLSFIVSPTIQQTFNIKPSGTQEILSLPFQQTARYVKENPDQVTEDEKAIINKVLIYDRLTSDYNPVNADPIKGGVPLSNDQQDYKNYLQVWAKQAINQPSSYISATNDHLAGWFSFSPYQPLTNMNHHNQINSTLIPEETASRSPFFSTTANLFDNIYSFIANIPIVGLIFTFAFFATVLPFFLLCTFIKRRKNTTQKYLLVCIPLFLSIFIGCYLAPVSAHLEGIRYLYPITYTTPIMLMLAISTYRDTKQSTMHKSN